jgi:hypothetical protein
MPSSLRQRPPLIDWHIDPMRPGKKLPKVDECMSGHYATLRDSLSGGSIICTTRKVPYIPRMREHLKLCTGITCTPEKSTKRHCDDNCACGAVSVFTNNSIVRMPGACIGREKCSCICHEVIMFISKRKLCFGMCQSLGLASTLL